jgi:hypothetical protein
LSRSQIAAIVDSQDYFLFGNSLELGIIKLSRDTGRWQIPNLVIAGKTWRDNFYLLHPVITEQVISRKTLTFYPGVTDIDAGGTLKPVGFRIFENSILTFSYMRIGGNYQFRESGIGNSHF